MDFKLHHNFLSKPFIYDFPICRVLLEDEQHYPWILLIPRRMHVMKVVDLSKEDQFQLMEELNDAQQIIWEMLEPDQLNVAAIGNKTPQLHLHIIARFQKDPAWPHTVWDHPIRAAYTQDEIKKKEKVLQEAFQRISK